ncbi:phosphoglycerate mutase [Streptomyces daghestanicus]|uniref:Phosphoglycerate mutase n=2 Tax=Streptomyces daghestanicus TaxID=66885 RepID=A0ABQ3PXU8_9ACTN|nr:MULTISPECIES: histidine phosphatase family protein [Streptomyces]GGT00198.1 phosphoglycerate mutase [Streptomyces griseoviridis]GGU24387.1 phosphoglycerate mutase [Streptomyces daghestanicus]GHI29833.1 phosphoglycerate mutase [Streptomyces daghestanicus]
MVQRDPVPPSGPRAVLVPPCPLGALWAVRHGESTANAAFAEAERSGRAARPVPGRDRDVPLTATGAAQARALGRWLADREPATGPDLVVCSPYRRARQTWDGMADTAAGARGASLPVLVDERLRDRETGVHELWPPALLRERAPEEAARRERVGEWWYRPPGGEALTDVAVRVGQFVTDLGAAAPGRRVLLVAHDAVVVALRQVLAGIGAEAPDRVPPVPNASVSHWRDDGHGRLRLAVWGGTDHLGPARPPAPDGG